MKASPHNRKKVAVMLSTLEPSQTFFFRDMEVYKNHIDPFIFILFRNRARTEPAFNKNKENYVFNGLSLYTIILAPLMFPVIILLSPKVFSKYMKVYCSLVFKKVLLKWIYIFYFPFILYHIHLVRKLGIEQIHAYWAGYSGTVAYIISSVLSIPYNIRVHAYDSLHPENELTVTLQAASEIIVCSEYIKNRIEHTFKDHLKTRPTLIHHIIPVPANPTSSSPANIPGDQIKLITIARIVPKKGIENVIMAQQLLIERGYDILYTIVGQKVNKHYYREITRKAFHSGLEGKINITGWIPNEQINNIIYQHRIYIQPSVIDDRSGDCDGIPNAMLEAMVCGLPVIASKAGGIPEIIQHGINGILVNPANPDEIVQSVTDIINGVYNLETIRKNAIKTVQTNFSAEQTTKKLGAVFNKMM